MGMGRELKNFHSEDVARTYPYTLVNDEGDFFYPDSLQDMLLMMEWHDAYPLCPGEWSRWFVNACRDWHIADRWELPIR